MRVNTRAICHYQVVFVCHIRIFFDLTRLLTISVRLMSCIGFVLLQLSFSSYACSASLISYFYLSFSFILLIIIVCIMRLRIFHRRRVMFRLRYFLCFFF